MFIHWTQLSVYLFSVANSCSNVWSIFFIITDLLKDTNDSYKFNSFIIFIMKGYLFLFNYTIYTWIFVWLFVNVFQIKLFIHQSNFIEEYSKLIITSSVIITIQSYITYRENCLNLFIINTYSWKLLLKLYP